MRGLTSTRRRALSRWAINCACAALVAAATAPGWAQGTPQSTSSAQADDEGVGEIIVTAQRRAQSLQDVPIVISSVSDQKLKSLAITQLGDVQTVVPGLVTGKVGAGGTPFLRGVGLISIGFGVEPQVSTYIDGFYLPAGAGNVNALNNVKRIEVLKGPQGTLFGRNSVAGVIQIITDDPGDQTKVDLTAGYGNYHSYEVKGLASARLSDTLSASVSATRTDQSKGWGHNVYSGNKAFYNTDTAVSAKLKWTPAEDTTFLLQGMYSETKGDVGVELTVAPRTVAIDGEANIGRYTVDHPDGYNRNRMLLGGLTVTHEADWGSIVSRTGYVDLNGHFRFQQNAIRGLPITGQSGFYQRVAGEDPTFSQEIQLLSPKGSKVNYILGGYFMQEDLNFSADNIPCLGRPYPVPFAAGLTCAAAPIPRITKSRISTKSYAAFSQADTEIVDNLRLTLGLRFTHDIKTFGGDALAVQGYPTSVASIPASHPGDPYTGNPDGIPTRKSWNRLTWRIALDYKLSQDVMLYAFQSRGFKAGTYNFVGFTNPPANPEVIDDYEVGVKSELLDGHLRLNLGGFYYDYRDLQLKTAGFPAPPGQTITYNAGSAKVKGIDLDFDATPVRGVSFYGGLEILDATYSSFANTTCTVPNPTGFGNISVACDLSGNRLTRSPKLSANLGVAVTQATEIGKISLNINDKYQSKFFWTPENNYAQRAYHYVSASAKLSPAFAPNTDIEFWIRNIFDAKFSSYVQASATGFQVAPGDPRTYGLRMSVHF